MGLDGQQCVGCLDRIALQAVEELHPLDALGELQSFLLRPGGRDWRLPDRGEILEQFPRLGMRLVLDVGQLPVQVLDDLMGAGPLMREQYGKARLLVLRGMAAIVDHDVETARAGVDRPRKISALALVAPDDLAVLDRFAGIRPDVEAV